jgi:GAF domain-containing protein
VARWIGEETPLMFASMARELAEVDGVRPTLQHLVTLAVTTVPCDWAAAVMAEQITAKPAPLSASSEPELFAEVARISGEAGSSPGWDAFDSGDMVHCADLDTETRYPAYAADMVRLTPIRSVLSFGLRLQDRNLGVLTIYGRRPGSFDDDAVRRAAVLADHATVAIDAAASADRADHLEIALQRNRVTGTAVGILVERLRLTPAQAFDLLRVMSQHTNRKLADLAAHLVDTGELPGVDDQPRASSASTV